MKSYCVPLTVRHAFGQDVPEAVSISITERPTALSFGEKFPQQGMPNGTFPYNHAQHTWNPMGNGLRSKSFNIPIFLLDDKLAEHSTKFSEFNSKQVKCLHQALALSFISSYIALCAAVAIIAVSQKYFLWSLEVKSCGA